MLLEDVAPSGPALGTSKTRFSFLNGEGLHHRGHREPQGARPPFAWLKAGGDGRKRRPYTSGTAEGGRPHIYLFERTKSTLLA